MDLKRSDMKTRVKASLTIEASFVITMIIFMSGIMLSLWIYKFQLCWYTQAANECLLTGSNVVVLAEKQHINAAKVKWDKVKEQNYLKPQDLKVWIDGSDEDLYIKIDGRTPLWGKEALKIYINQKIGIVKPVKFIRKIEAVQEVVGR